MILKTDAIVLRCIEYSNTSQIASLLTDNQGKISVIAKGIRRQSKTNCPAPIEVFNHLSVVYYQKRTDQLAVLKEHTLKDHFPGIRDHLGKIFSALYWIELIRGCTGEGDPNPSLFSAILLRLKQLSQVRCPINSFFHTHWHLLAILGIAPHLESCLRCRLSLSHVQHPDEMFFSSRRGGVLCSNCKDPGGSVRLSSSTCKKISTLFTTGEPVLWTAAEYHEFYSVFRFHLHTLINQELRLARYLMDYQTMAFGQDAI